MDLSQIVTKQDQIDLLVRRKFRALARLPSAREQVSAYRIELTALTEEALSDLYEQAKKAERKEMLQRGEFEESQRPFNRKAARSPDFGYWGKADLWTVDEGIALLLERTPAAAKWDSVSAFVNISPFAKQFDALRDLAMRSVSIKQLGTSNLPSHFLEWARKKELPIPEELEAEVSKHSGDILDWKKLHDEIKSELQQTRNEIEAIRQEREQLAAAAKQTASCSYDPDDPKWRNSEMDIAMQAWLAACRNAEKMGKRPGVYLREWVAENYPDRAKESKAFVDRIATVANWDKTPGPLK